MRKLLPGHLILTTVDKKEIILSIECDTCEGEGLVLRADGEHHCCGDCEGTGQLLNSNGETLLEFLAVFKN